MEILGWFKGYVWVRKNSHFFLFFLKCSLPYSCVFFTAQSKEILSRLISNVFQAWCKGLQGVTTYLMLTTYSWMLCEGAYLRFILVRLMQHFEVGVIHPWWYSLTFGWPPSKLSHTNTPIYILGPWSAWCSSKLGPNLKIVLSILDFHLNNITLRKSREKRNILKNGVLLNITGLKPQCRALKNNPHNKLSCGGLSKWKAFPGRCEQCLMRRDGCFGWKFSAGDFHWCQCFPMLPSGNRVRDTLPTISNWKLNLKI